MTLSSRSEKARCFWMKNDGAESSLLHADLMSRSILFYPQGTVGAREIFSHFRKLDVREYQAKAPESTKEFQPEILIANTRLSVNRETISRYPTVKVFATVSSGIDHVNFSDLKEEGRVFLNSPGCNAGSVAEYCWVGLRHFFSEEELRKKKVGLFGYGNTGREFANILSKKGISFVFNDPFLKHQSVSVQEVLSCPILSFHVPLTKDGPYPTIGMFGEGEAAGLQPGTLVMNTSRGEIWTEKAYDILAERKDLYRVWDVFLPEPLSGEFAKKIAALPNSVFTPHIAGYSQLGRLLGTYRLAKKLCILYQDGPLPPLEHFLLSEGPIRTETFLASEDADLRKSWQEEDWQYFERRRNSYPVRIDMGLFEIEH